MTGSVKRLKHRLGFLKAFWALVVLFSTIWFFHIRLGNYFPSGVDHAIASILNLPILTLVCLNSIDGGLLESAGTVGHYASLVLAIFIPSAVMPLAFLLLKRTVPILDPARSPFARIYWPTTAIVFAWSSFVELEFFDVGWPPYSWPHFLTQAGFAILNPIELFVIAIVRPLTLGGRSPLPWLAIMTLSPFLTSIAWSLPLTAIMRKASLHAVRRHLRSGTGRAA